MRGIGPGNGKRRCSVIGSVATSIVGEVANVGDSARYSVNVNRVRGGAIVNIEIMGAATTERPMADAEVDTARTRQGCKGRSIALLCGMRVIDSA